MGWWQYVSAAVAVLSLLLNIGIAVVAATWGVARIQMAVSDAIEKHRQDFEDKITTIERQHGEVAAALRQKIHEFELWSRDTFVRRDSFLTVINEVKGGILDLGKQIDRRLDRMENRLYGDKGGTG